MSAIMPACGALFPWRPLITETGPVVSGLDAALECQAPLPAAPAERKDFGNAPQSELQQQLGVTAALRAYWARQLALGGLFHDSPVAEENWALAQTTVLKLQVDIVRNNDAQSALQTQPGSPAHDVAMAKVAADAKADVAAGLDQNVARTSLDQGVALRAAQAAPNDPQKQDAALAATSASDGAIIAQQNFMAVQLTATADPTATVVHGSSQPPSAIDTKAALDAATKLRTEAQQEQAKVQKALKSNKTAEAAAARKHSDNSVFSMVTGGVEVFGGVLGEVGSTALDATGVGAVVGVAGNVGSAAAIADGVSRFGGGAISLATGDQNRSLLNRGLQSFGATPNAAARIDAAFGVVGTLGTGAAGGLGTLVTSSSVAARLAGSASGLMLADTTVQQSVYASTGRSYSPLVMQALEQAGLSATDAQYAQLVGGLALPVGTVAVVGRDANLIPTAPSPAIEPISGQPSGRGILAPAPATVSETGFGGYRATFGRDPRAFAMFEPEDSGVDVTDLFRGEQPKGSGGSMLADALRNAGLIAPQTIRFSNILDSQPTLRQLAEGVAPSDTALGRTLASAIEELGGKPIGWDYGTYRGKTWIRAHIVYPP